MKNNLFNYLKYIVFCVAISCGGGGDDPGGEETPTPPGSFSLLSPANNAVCIENTFSWSTSQYATSYQISVFEASGSLLSGFPKNSSNENYTAVNLPHGIAITWSVKAVNSKGEQTSNTWSGSTQGESVSNYIPAILEFTVNSTDDNIYVKTKDNENEALSYSFYLSSDSSFDSSELLYNQVPVTDLALDSDNDTREFYIENIGFTSQEINWLKLLVKDVNGNQVPYVLPYFYE